MLSIEICGPDRPQLTLVDLPGLTNSENQSQSRDDVILVSELVERYIAESRTIILPIISAKNDYANQIIPDHVRRVKPDGSRTLGIITKPDDLPPGSDSEKSFVSLARNEEKVITFKLVGMFSKIGASKSANAFPAIPTFPAFPHNLH